MFHVVLVGLAATLLCLAWLLVRWTPRATALLFPGRIMTGVGTGVFLAGTFFATANAQAFRDPNGVLASFVLMIVGLWLLLSATSGQRGTYYDDMMLKRVFAMIGVLFAVLIAGLYAPQTQLIAIFNLFLVSSGFWLTSSYLRHLNRGR